MPCISTISSFWLSVGYWARSQSKALRRPYFLDVDEFEERLEVAMPLAEIGAGKGPDRFRPLRVDIAEQKPLNLVVDRRAEEGRIQIRPTECYRGRRVLPLRPMGLYAPIFQNDAFRRQVEVRERSPSRLEEPFLVPLWDVMIVSRYRHRSESFGRVIARRVYHAPRRDNSSTPPDGAAV